MENQKINLLSPVNVKQEIRRRSYGECAEAWEKLIKGESVDSKGIDLTNTTLSSTPSYSDAAAQEIPSASPAPAAPIDKSIDKWFFISGAH